MAFLQSESARLRGIRETARAPLRRILREVKVEIVPGVKAWRDLLECGHLIPHASDIYGERHPERRRCKRCAQGIRPGMPQSPQ